MEFLATLNTVTNAMLLIIMAVVPCLIYTLVIWATMPFSSIRLQTAFRYLTTGIISVVVLKMMWELMPGYFAPSIGELMKMPTHDDMFHKAFFQVALPEEAAKLIAFIVIEHTRENYRKDHPVGTMFYFGMVGLSFGLIENIQYAVMYGEEILLVRTFTSLLLHMLLGFLAGYWYSFAKMERKKPGRSLFSILCYHYPKFRMISYCLLSLSLVSFIHGIYDYNLFTFTNSSPSLMFTQLGLTSLATYLAAQHLIITRSKNLQ